MTTIWNNSINWNKMKELDLSENEFTSNQVQRLLKIKQLKGVRKLNLTGIKIEDEFRLPPSLSELTDLEIGGKNFDFEDLTQIIARLGNSPKLKYLVIEGCLIQVESLEFLLE